MNPITHLFLSWTVAEEAGLGSRDRACVTWAGVAPDLDGLSLLPDLIVRWLYGVQIGYYFEYHHFLTHGLPVAILTAVLVFCVARARWRTALLALLTFHLHLFCDLLGSRGPDPADLYPIAYLMPFSRRLILEWSGQWPLNAWPNIAITLMLMALILVRTVYRGYSPVALFSQRADKAVVAALRTRFQPR